MMVSLLRLCLLLLIGAGLWLPIVQMQGEKAQLGSIIPPEMKPASARDGQDKPPAPQDGTLEQAMIGVPHEGSEVKKTAVGGVAKPASLKDMIGQMLMLGFKGTKPSEPGPQAARALLASGEIGGLIFMGENLVSRQQVKELVAYMKTANPRHGAPFISIDQEGGFVQRLQERHGFTMIPAAELVAVDDKIDEARKTYNTLASELADVGFNMNFGPVVDLNLVPSNPIIGAKARSYGADPKKVQRFAKAFVKAHRGQNMLTAIKHFPGHGSSWTDSHEQFVDLSESWKTQELEPYRVLVKAGMADLVMVGHLYHPDFSDEKGRPASLSHKAIIKRLRGDLGFKGLVITDDLGMGAVRKYFDFSEALILAVNAGNDILLVAAGHYAGRRDVDLIQKTLLDAVAAGRISRARIRRSYQRIIAAKARLAEQKAARGPSK